MSEHKEYRKLRFNFVQDKPWIGVLLFDFFFSEAKFVPPVDKARKQKQIWKQFVWNPIAECIDCNENSINSYSRQRAGNHTYQMHARCFCVVSARNIDSVKSVCAH